MNNTPKSKGEIRGPYFLFSMDIYFIINIPGDEILSSLLRTISYE